MQPLFFFSRPGGQSLPAPMPEEPAPIVLLPAPLVLVSLGDRVLPEPEPEPPR